MRSLFLLPLLIAVCSLAKAQAPIDPAHWKYDVKKNGTGHYTLTIHATIDSGYHLYAMDAGGDGTLIPTTISFTDNKRVTLDGPVKQSPEPTTVDIEDFGTVHYFTGNVDFIQEVTASGKTKLTGELQYQCCNDRMCFPPKTIKVSFTLK